MEAKPEGTPLSGVAEQTAEYLAGLPPAIPHVDEPLPFAYECSGVETFFRSERDPQPRSRRVFSFHQPATLVAGPDRRSHWGQPVDPPGRPGQRRILAERRAAGGDASIGEGFCANVG